MIPVPFLKGKRVVVMGLGKSGTATARALLASGVGVMAWDDSEASQRAAAETAIPIANPLAINLAKADLVVWSPGIPHTHPQPHPVAEKARAAAIPVVCDVELLARAKPDHRFLAVTGTAIVTGAADKGTWVRLLQPPIEGRLASGFEGLDVGQGVRVQLVRTDVERGYIDFTRVV